ncbi:MAG: YHS domain-containing protein [Candidatus Competibacteraceae bacterium]|jgi:YHS domain-containing protein|nr:YHS domain-containing protein [Candidatus Competibacteraceae bacterium]
MKAQQSDRRQQPNRDINKDPVCGKRINRNKAHIEIRYQGQDYLLCCPVCQAEFERAPEKYIR